MSEFKTPTAKKIRSRIVENPEFHTPIKIPPSPYLKQIGYGCGKTTLVPIQFFLNII